jgi:hypothetical protein
MRHFIAGAFVSTGIIASVASAGGSAEGITWFNDKDIWEAAPAVFSFPKSWVTDFVDVAVGKTPEGDHAQLSGGADWNAWAITAGTGDLTATGALVYTTLNGSSLRLDFGGKPGIDGSGLHGVGGNFLLRNSDGTFFNGEIRIELSNGEAIEEALSKNNPFAGFWSTDPLLTITSMTLTPSGFSPPDFSIGIQDLYLGYAGVPVPAPGALALLGAAGLVGLARRRR